jgi:hypothetical protein
MLVDRNLILDLIAVESKRENGYRHPHCMIVTLALFRSREEHAENCMKNTHVQAFELIEESFDSNSWFCVVSLCIDVVLMNVCFLSHIFFYMLCM